MAATEFTVKDEQLVIHPTFANLAHNKSGVTLEARCIGEVEIDGVCYEFNRVIKFRARPPRE